MPSGDSSSWAYVCTQVPSTGASLFFLRFRPPGQRIFGLVGNVQIDTHEERQRDLNSRQLWGSDRVDMFGFTEF
jgi:hypothetical protein